VLDIGAGTGIGLKRVAAMLPRHDIVAVEPSPALRVGLFARLSEDPALAARVTVLPVTVQEAVLPSQLGAAVGINMLGHLPPADRVALWARLAAVLSPGAPAVFTLQPPERPERIPEQPFAAAVAGPGGTPRPAPPSPPAPARSDGGSPTGYTKGKRWSPSRSWRTTGGSSTTRSSRTNSAAAGWKRTRAITYSSRAAGSAARARAWG
jgi:hypothetical protein